MLRNNGQELFEGCSRCTQLRTAYTYNGRIIRDVSNGCSLWTQLRVATHVRKGRTGTFPMETTCLLNEEWVQTPGKERQESFDGSFLCTLLRVATHVKEGHYYSITLPVYSIKSGYAYQERTDMDISDACSLCTHLRVDIHVRQRRNGSILMAVLCVLY